MEDSFRVRVDKIFGSLSSSSTSSSSPSPLIRSLWCLTDDELERKEWNRDKGSPETEPPPFPSNFDGFFANHRTAPEKNPVHLCNDLEDDLQDLNDEDDDNDDDDEPLSRAQSRLRYGIGTANDDEWEIRSSIGLDCTLDNEEEEDDYDKVAVGKENSTHCLYMSGLNDYGVDVNSYKVLPDSFKEAVRDPRANHIAARFRLKEDAEAVKNFDSLQVSIKTAPALVDTRVKPSDDGSSLKPILKRKETQKCEKTEKRVRFDPGCKSCYRGKESIGNKDKVVKMDTSLMEEAAVSEEEVGCHNKVPDHIRNPSKYMHYSLDITSGVDEASNRQAYMDFLNLLKKSKGMESQPDDTSFDLPKSVTFTPKKKTSDVAAVRRRPQTNKQNEEDVANEPVQRKALPISIVAEDTEDNEACMMDEDDPGIAVDKANNMRKAGRQYRRKDKFELDDPIA